MLQTRRILALRAKHFYRITYILDKLQMPARVLRVAETKDDIPDSVNYLSPMDQHNLPSNVKTAAASMRLKTTSHELFM